MAMGDKLLAIMREERQRTVDERAKPLRECPYDGSPLNYRNGVYDCPMGDYRTRRTTRDPDGP